LTKKQRTSPLSYSAPQVLEQALGFHNTEGHVVLTKSFTEDLITELERLYSVEAAAIELVNGLSISEQNQAVQVIKNLGDPSLLNIERED